MANKLDPIGQSSLGMGENVAALLAIIFAPISAIIVLLMEKESKFAKFHSIQAIALSVVIFVITTILSITVIGLILVPFIAIGSFILWIMMLIKAYQGEWFELPVIGKFSMQQINK